MKHPKKQPMQVAAHSAIFQKLSCRNRQATAACNFLKTVISCCKQESSKKQ